MKITLHYDFNEFSHDGRESILVKGKDFKYEVNLKKKELELSVQDIIDKYHDSALASAAYNVRCQLQISDTDNRYY